jgi:hypothetical protein
MNSRSAVTWMGIAGMALCQAACYVVPIDPRYPPEAGHPVVIAHAPHGTPVAVPPPQPAPLTLQARLYPLNDIAGKTGALTATVVDNLHGHGTFSVMFAGELLQGEASRVANDYPGFGRVHREVYGEGRMPSGRRGIASAAGHKGTFVNCEYALSGASQGTGACQFSNGAKYQLHFGA